MYRIIKAEGKDGISKLESIAAIHSLKGKFFIEPKIGGAIYFIYKDDSNQMMRSSLIVDINETDKQLHIETLNSTYWFEKVED